MHTNSEPASSRALVDQGRVPFALRDHAAENLDLRRENESLRYQVKRLQASNLTNENEELRARLDLMERELGCSGMLFPLEWKLTRHEGEMLALLIKRPLLTKEQAMVGLYSERGVDWPEVKIVDVFLCKLRKKLLIAQENDISAFIEIKTVWGRGYMIDEETRTRLRTQYMTAKPLVALAKERAA